MASDYLKALAIVNDARLEKLRLIDQAEQVIVLAVSKALEDGATWAQIGESMRCDRATAYKWYKHRAPQV